MADLLGSKNFDQTDNLGTTLRLCFNQYKYFLKLARDLEIPARILTQSNSMLLLFYY